MKIAICCIIKDEHLFLEEWIKYHLDKVKIDFIQLYEDFGSKSHKDIVDKFGDKVNLINLDTDSCGIKNTNDTLVQRRVYLHFIDQCKQSKKFDWVIFIDVDEFVMFEKGYTLRKLCKEFSKYPAIWLSWRLYNANGHIERPKGGVMENYTKAMPDNTWLNNSPKWNTKSIVNVKKFNGGEFVHNVDGGVLTNGSGTLDNGLCYEKAWINHYFSKSFEDYCYRIQQRGNMSNNFRSYDDFFLVNPEMNDRMEELIEKVRYEPAKSIMYISRKLRLIAGGNARTIEKLNEQIRNGRL